jgi:hypothetical protein
MLCLNNSKLFLLTGTVGIVCELLESRSVQQATLRNILKEKTNRYEMD